MLQNINKNMENKRDEQIQELFKVVQTKKTEIAKAEKPSWLTNCVFRYDKESSTSINLQVTSNIDELVSIVGFLVEKKRGIEAADDILGKTTIFKWLSFTFDEWVTDIKTRINKIEISKKKKELEQYESALDRLISPQLKEQMEIDDIASKLKNI